MAPTKSSCIHNSKCSLMQVLLQTNGLFWSNTVSVFQKILLSETIVVEAARSKDYFCLKDNILTCWFPYRPCLVQEEADVRQPVMWTPELSEGHSCTKLPHPQLCLPCFLPFLKLVHHVGTTPNTGQLSWVLQKVKSMNRNYVSASLQQLQQITTHCPPKSQAQAPLQCSVGKSNRKNGNITQELMLLMRTQYWQKNSKVNIFKLEQSGDAIVCWQCRLQWSLQTRNTQVSHLVLSSLYLFIVRTM